MTTNPECFVFNDGQNQNALATMMGGGMNGMWNNPIWALVFLAFLGRDGIFGNGGNNCATQNQLASIQETLNTNHGQTLLMDAIRGNSTSIKELATTIGCNFNAVQQAINAVQSAISNLGSRNDMNAMQVMNAINSGNAMLANQLSSCCCEVKQLVTNFGYENRINNLEQSNMITKGFGDMAYGIQAQTNALNQNADGNTRSILAKLDAIEDARKDREISTLTAQLATVNARAERQAELAPIVQKLNDIMCKQPQTVTLPYSCATAIPTSMAYAAYGANPYSLNGGGVFG